MTLKVSDVSKFLVLPHQFLSLYFDDLMNPVTQNNMLNVYESKLEPNKISRKSNNNTNP
jgi:hypothetical protein